MNERLKSAFELAMERLRAKDGEAGARPLTDEQRSRIAALRREFEARRAEASVLHESAVAKARAAGDAERVLKLEDEFQHEMAHLAEQEEAQVQSVRGA